MILYLDRDGLLAMEGIGFSPVATIVRPEQTTETDPTSRAGSRLAQRDDNSNTLFKETFFTGH